ncbi:MAG: 2-dehydro-3-deoxygalactonokinase [Clostridia bacterium]|nr:2-dehydro-3-deoxygalactonokinase [Clostridia bacterium]
MASYITVDGGTTNTRLYLVCDGSVVAEEKLSVGARNGAEALKSAVKDGISRLLDGCGITENQVTAILASGMITSEYGLCNLPHITLPAGRRELREAMERVEFPEISALPWYFIRGVKSVGETLEETDVMRGEETELMGILDGDAASGALYVLPGSHSKHVSVDGEGRIVGFCTMLSGELFAAVMQNTILRDAADFEHNTVIEEKLYRGYEYCRDRGINEALFKTRILKNLFAASKEECYSYLLGCVLCHEVGAIIGRPEEAVIIGGQKQFRLALSSLLRRYGEKRVVTLSDEAVARSTALGAVKIFEA